MMPAPCPNGCPPGIAALMAALDEDDLDRAIALGLLDSATAANACAGCDARISLARDMRLRALAARERYRARTARLAARAEARARRRAAVAPAPDIPASDIKAPALPPAAASALARAKAIAAAKQAK